MTEVLRVAAFCDGDTGGIPACVLITETMPADDEMQRLAAEVADCETVFAAPIAGGWGVRYFTPQAEIAACDHATIALGAALAVREGDGVFALSTNDSRITVEASFKDGRYLAVLQSPPTKSKTAPGPLVEAVLEIFDFGKVDLHRELPARRVSAGADQLLIGLASVEALSARHYGLSAGQLLLDAADLVGIVLAWPAAPQRFHMRNPFASVGVFDDPATSAAAGAAALAGYLRDVRWPHGGSIEVIYGEDMGQRSLLRADISDERGSAIRVSGQARFMEWAHEDWTAEADLSE